MTSTAALYSTMTGKAASYLNSLTGTVVSLYDMTGMAACYLYLHTSYRVTHHVVQNLPLTSKQKFRLGLANFRFEVNRRFWTT